MADFTINNIGATITGCNNGDGTYTITAKGSKLGSKPEVQILTEDEVVKKFGDKVNLKQDMFDRNLGGRFSNGLKDFADYSQNFPTVKYNPLIGHMKALQAYAAGNEDLAQEIALDNLKKQFDPRNPYIWL